MMYEVYYEKRKGLDNVEFTEYFHTLDGAMTYVGDRMNNPVVVKVKVQKVEPLNSFTRDDIGGEWRMEK